nr:ActR/PrrA/RegA family redox response regulator transcription factor [Aurantimonas marina]
MLLVDDDRSFLLRMSRELEQRGFDVVSADSLANGLERLRAGAPACAVIDLRLGDGSGLDLVAAPQEARHGARSVILTGYGNIATAVAAVKLGAIDYLTKPADVEDIVAVLAGNDEARAESLVNSMSADRVRWEHIQRIYELCDRNVSETARRLSVHRRTLQRILAKHARR